jgi:hypothetical protein
VGLITAANNADPALSWLRAAESLGSQHVGLFEVQLSPTTLNEWPRQTAVDYLVSGSTGVIAVEAKFTEQGFGSCSCEQRSTGQCSARVLQRPYWRVAETELCLRRGHDSCALSIAYQPVRNVAAARMIAGKRAATFALLYDARNPYFSGTGNWPGWTAILSQLMQNSAVRFEAVSWQQLLADSHVDEHVRTWAHAKHGFEPEGLPPATTTTRGQRSPTANKSRGAHA